MNNKYHHTHSHNNSGADNDSDNTLIAKRKKSKNNEKTNHIKGTHSSYPSTPQLQLMHQQQARRLLDQEFEAGPPTQELVGEKIGTPDFAQPGMSKTRGTCLGQVRTANCRPGGLGSRAQHDCIRRGPPGLPLLSMQESCSSGPVVKRTVRHAPGSLWRPQGCTKRQWIAVTKIVPVQVHLWVGIVPPVPSELSGLHGFDRRPVEEDADKWDKLVVRR